MVLDVSLLTTQHYKVSIKGSEAIQGVVAIEKGTFGSPSTMVANFTFMFYLIVSDSI